METAFKIKPSELDMNFIDAIKRLFSNRSQIQITVSDIDSSSAIFPDQNSVYDISLAKAIENIESGKELITFSIEEFDKIVEEKLK